MQSLSQHTKPDEMPKSMKVYRTIFMNEGMLGFYTGLKPNILRNIVVNVGEMASYDQLKEVMLKYTPLKEGYFLHFVCGLVIFYLKFYSWLGSSPLAFQVLLTS